MSLERSSNRYSGQNALSGWTGDPEKIIAGVQRGPQTLDQHPECRQTDALYYGFLVYATTRGLSIDQVGFGVALESPG
jgi:hypothetical protein